MKNTTIYRFLLSLTVLSWAAFLILLILIYLNFDLIWGLFLSFTAACVSTVMLSKFRSGNY